MLWQRIKNNLLIIALLAGALFYPFFARLSFLMPFFIFTMLLITYCRIPLREITFNRMHAQLLGIQLIGSLICYLLLRFFDTTLAESTAICILIPTATAAPVITALLGGNAGSVVSYTLLSNLVIAFVAPLCFSQIGAHGALPFSTALYEIARQVVPLLIGPLLAALLLQYLLPSVHRVIHDRQAYSFYIWVLAIAVVIGRTVETFFSHGGGVQELLLALFSLLACLLQFIIGRRIGAKYNNTVAAGQALGQKNTLLAIWMAQTYLHPLSAIGPSAYIVWQNCVNSYQLTRARKHPKETQK